MDQKEALIGVGSEPGDPVDCPVEHSPITTIPEAAAQDKSGGRTGAILVTLLVHVAVAMLLWLIVVAIPSQVPPQLVATSAPVDASNQARKREVVRPVKSKPSPPSQQPMAIINAAATSNIAAPTIEFTETTDSVNLGTSFGAGVGFGGGGSGSGFGSGGGAIEGTVGGQKIRAKKLGVILDISGSMTRYLPKLRKEIRDKFEDSEFREVVGCRIDINGRVLDAIRELVEDEKVDTIFWFCDLNDGESEEGLTELTSILHNRRPPPPKRSETSSGLDAFAELQEGKRSGSMPPLPPCRFYVQSVGRPAQSPLELVIEQSGGEFKKHVP